MPEPILQVEDLRINYYTKSKLIEAVQGVRFTIYKNEVFGLVGESGCGKTTLAMGILQLVQAPGKIESGRIDFDGTDLLTASPEKFRSILWNEIAYIPQGAMSALNPVTRLRHQFLDVIHDHGGAGTKQEQIDHIHQMLAGVHLSPSVLDMYPHELSGGMKQRACIALAMVLRPKLIIADEPTSALDVVSQRVVLETLSKARQELGASMIFIGHDMAVQAQISHRLGIMYAGNFVEIAPVREIFENPHHAYTERLISSIPSIRKKQDVHEIAKVSFSESEKIRFQKPAPLVEISVGHFVAQHDRQPDRIEDV